MCKRPPEETETCPSLCGAQPCFDWTFTEAGCLHKDIYMGLLIASHGLKPDEPVASQIRIQPGC